MLYAIVGMLVIILDQGVKFWVTNNIMLDVVTEPLIPGILSLVRLHNDGAAFSFLAGGGARIYFIVLTGIFTVAVIVALVTNFISGRFGRWCLVLVTAGGLSNCIDRILYGFVVDMFKIDLFDFAVFNVADIFITVFALLFIVYIIFGGEPDGREYDEFDEEDDEDLDRPDMRGSLKESLSDRRAARTEKAMLAAEQRAADKRASRRSSKYEPYEDEEDEAPLRGFGRKAKKADAASDAPRRDKGTSRKDKRAKTLYEEDYEQFKANMAARPADERSKGRARAPEAPVNDPFAEWEKANARFESRQSSSSTARAMGVAPATRRSRDEEDVETFEHAFGGHRAKAAPPSGTPAASAPVRRAAPAPVEDDFEDIPPRPTRSAPTAAAPAAPARSAEPASRPAPAAPAAAAKPTADDEFSLDDILAEFR